MGTLVTVLTLGHRSLVAGVKVFVPEPREYSFLDENKVRGYGF